MTGKEKPWRCRFAGANHLLEVQMIGDRYSGRLLIIYTIRKRLALVPLPSSIEAQEVRS
jgi:hypothetical protein